MRINDMFVGAKNRNIMKAAPKDDSVISEFLDRASAATLPVLSTCRKLCMEQ